MAPHPADSLAQRNAEVAILRAVELKLGLPTLEPRSVSIDDEHAVQVDGVSADELVLVEAYARQGSLKGGQLKKIAQDVLKLVALQRVLPRQRRVIAFASEAANTSVRGWVRAVAERDGIQFVVVDVSPDVRREIEDAQARQRTAMIPVEVAVDDIADEDPV